MDATAMTFHGDSFHLAVDKGTLDAMMSPGTNEFAGATRTEFWNQLFLLGSFRNDSDSMTIIEGGLSCNSHCVLPVVASNPTLSVYCLTIPQPNSWCFHGLPLVFWIPEAMLEEVWRVLRPEGLLIVVSHSGKRLQLLKSHGTWQCLEIRKCRLSPQAGLGATATGGLGAWDWVDLQPAILRQPSSICCAANCLLVRP